MTTEIFADVGTFSEALRGLHAARKDRVIAARKENAARATLTKAERAEILRKTAGRCHICGGDIGIEPWQADHVLAHSAGGQHSVDNYLAAHAICNNYRWHYDAEEFQWILKIGVWMRTQIERETTVGQEAGAAFCDYERRRAGRRKSS